jgi:hypothetical protein
MACWHADLQEYDFEIKHIPGNTNIMANALSQPPGTDQGESDNQSIVMIPPTRVCAIKAFNIIPPEQPNKGFLQQLMASLRDSPLSGHPG